MKDVWLIIPAFNEGKRIALVIEKAKAYCRNIIVIDDGSKDETAAEAKKCGVRVIQHCINLGKGAAIKTGCVYALKQKASIIILMDADGQHDPAEIPHFLKALKDADIVFGYRKFSTRMPIIFRIGNRVISKITKLLYRIDLKDTQSGYRAFKAHIYPKLCWEARDYSMESEMIANVGKHHIAYAEVPIATIYADKYKGTTVLDGIRIVINMILWKFKR